MGQIVDMTGKILAVKGEEDAIISTVLSKLQLRNKAGKIRKLVISEITDDGVLSYIVGSSLVHPEIVLGSIETLKIQYSRHISYDEVEDD